MEGQRVGYEAEQELCDEYDPMPFMQPRIEGVDLAEGKKEHEEDEPREDGLEGQEPGIKDCSDDHAQP